MTHLLLLILVAAAFQADSSDWGQWRGPDNTGVATADAPVSWSDASNVVWKVEIPGRGFSTPAVWGDRIVLTTAIPTGKPAAAPAEAAPTQGRRRQAPPPVEHRFVVMALNRATGKAVWEKTATVARDGSNNWSTPSVITHDGRKQIVVSAPAAVHAYDFETGRSVWSATGLGHNTVPQPVQHGDMVFVMSGYRNPKLLAIRLGREGDLTGTDAIVWTQDRAVPYTATPAIHDGILYLITDTAMVSAFRADTGEPLYHQVRLPKPYNIKASPVIANGKIYYATEEGDVVVAKIGPTPEILATNTLTDQSFIASPVMPGGELFLRSRTHLFRITN